MAVDLRQKSDFEALAMVHLDSLYSTALRMAHDAGDAEDLVQDAMLSAYRFFDQFETGSNFKAWLFKILTNTFINKYRRRLREREVKERFDAEPAGDPPRDPESELFSRLVSNDVRRALERVPYDYRMAVVLSDLQEFSYKEIAEIMNCPVGTVMSRLHRGRKLLKRALFEETADEASPGQLIAFPGAGRAAD